MNALKEICKLIMSCKTLGQSPFFIQKHPVHYVIAKYVPLIVYLKFYVFVQMNHLFGPEFN